MLRLFIFISILFFDAWSDAGAALGLAGRDGSVGEAGRLALFAVADSGPAVGGGGAAARGRQGGPVPPCPPRPRGGRGRGGGGRGGVGFLRRLPRRSPPGRL